MYLFTMGHVSRNIIITVTLLVIISTIWVSWTAFLNSKVTGQIIAPIGDKEVSPLLPGVELNNLVTGNVLSGINELSILVPDDMILETFVRGNGNVIKLYSGVPNGTALIEFDTAQLPDAVCAYKLYIRVSNETFSSSDVTGLFSVYNEESVNYVQEPYTVGVGGIGKLLFSKGIVHPGTDVEVDFSNGKLNLKEKDFPCWGNPGSSVRVYFQGINFVEPSLLLNGQNCKRCRRVKYENGTFVVDLYRLGNYELVEGRTASLTVSNPTEDYKVYHVGEEVPFSAIYSTIEGIPITNGRCTITFPDGNQLMGYQEEIYTYKRTFENAGKFEYLVNCENDIPTNDVCAADFYKIHE